MQPRTNYPRPWLGGEWTLRDIVDYELIVSLATLEAAADTRERLNRQIYEVNRSTIEQFLEGEATGGATNELGWIRPAAPERGCRASGNGTGHAGSPGGRRHPLRRGFPTRGRG